MWRGVVFLFFVFSGFVFPLHTPHSSGFSVVFSVPSVIPVFPPQTISSEDLYVLAVWGGGGELNITFSYVVEPKTDQIKIHYSTKNTVVPPGGKAKSFITISVFEGVVEGEYEVTLKATAVAGGGEQGTVAYSSEFKLTLSVSSTVRELRVVVVQPDGSPLFSLVSVGVEGKKLICMYGWNTSFLLAPAVYDVWVSGGGFEERRTADLREENQTIRIVASPIRIVNVEVREKPREAGDPAILLIIIGCLDPLTVKKHVVLEAGVDGSWRSIAELTVSGYSNYTVTAPVEPEGSWREGNNTVSLRLRDKNNNTLDLVTLIVFVELQKGAREGVPPLPVAVVLFVASVSPSLIALLQIRRMKRVDILSVEVWCSSGIRLLRVNPKEKTAFLGGVGKDKKDFLFLAYTLQQLEGKGIHTIATPRAKYVVSWIGEDLIGVVKIKPWQPEGSKRVLEWIEKLEVLTEKLGKTCDDFQLNTKDVIGRIMRKTLRVRLIEQE